MVLFKLQDRSKSSTWLQVFRVWQTLFEVQCAERNHFNEHISRQRARCTQYLAFQTWAVLTRYNASLITTALYVDQRIARNMVRRGFQQMRHNVALHHRAYAVKDMLDQKARTLKVRSIALLRFHAVFTHPSGF